MKSHKDLDVWRAAIDMAPDKGANVGRVRRARLQRAERAERAERAARQGNKEFVQFLYVAVGSANELDTQLEISKAAKLVDAGRLDVVQTQVTRVTMMLNGLIRSLKTKH